MRGSNECSQVLSTAVRDVQEKIYIWPVKNVTKVAPDTTSCALIILSSLLHTVLSYMQFYKFLLHNSTSLHSNTTLHGLRIEQSTVHKAIVTKCRVSLIRIAHLFNEEDSGFQVEPKVDEVPLDAFPLVLLLFKDEHVVVEELL